MEGSVLLEDAIFVLKMPTSVTIIMSVAVNRVSMSQEVINVLAGRALQQQKDRKNAKTLTNVEIEMVDALIGVLTLLETTFVIVEMDM